MRDSTLAANLFTAYVPRFPIIDRLSHLAESVFSLAKSAFGCLCRSRSTPPPAGLRPPGDVNARPLGEVEPGALARSRPILLKSAETRKDLPMLDPAEADNAMRYVRACKRAWSSDTSPLKDGLEDAFTYDKLPVGDIAARKTASKDEALTLLPPEVTESTLLNSKSTISPGQIGDEIINKLVDKRTGFVAAISYDPQKREVIIGFAGTPSQGMAFRQGVRCFLQWLGFVPKNMSQASKLTKVVKEHLDKVNASLPEGQKKITLTLAGHSMGGGLASYAALRNKVPAIVTNPMRLGNGARARIGQTRLDEASKYVTEVVVQGDWLSDNRASWIYLPLKILGIDSFGPLGTARRFMVPHVPYWNDPHNDTSSSFCALQFPAKSLSNTMKHFPESDPGNAEIREAMLARRDFRPLLERVMPPVPDSDRKYRLQLGAGEGGEFTLRQLREGCIDCMAELLKQQAEGRSFQFPQEEDDDFERRIKVFGSQHALFIKLTEKVFSDKLASDPLKSFLLDFEALYRNLVPSAPPLDFPEVDLDESLERLYPDVKSMPQRLNDLSFDGVLRKLDDLDAGGLDDANAKSMPEDFSKLG